MWSTALESAYPKPLAVAWAHYASQSIFGTRPPPTTSHQRKRAMWEPSSERREHLTSPEILKWGPLAPACAPPPHLPFPKGTKILHLQWEPPEAILTVPQEPLVWCKMAMGLPHPARCPPDMPPELQAAIRQEAQTPLAASRASTSPLRGASRASSPSPSQ